MRKEKPARCARVDAGQAAAAGLPPFLTSFLPSLSAGWTKKEKENLKCYIFNLKRNLRNDFNLFRILKKSNNQKIESLELEFSKNIEKKFPKR